MTGPAGQVTVVDAAGARMGGAARFLSELDAYLLRHRRDAVRVLGRGRSLSPGWLVHRELQARSTDRVVALNNVGFLATGRERWVLLRNALHFPTPAERAAGVPADRAMWLQVPLVRAAAHRADVVVVPCTAMAERVLAVLPRLRPRLIVRPHPVSPIMRAGDRPGRPTILVPVLFAGYKRMDQQLTALLLALRDLGRVDIEVHVTANSDELEAVADADGRLVGIGRLPYDRLRQAWATSQAVYFPTSTESFGYPLAEARAAGLPVIAQDVPQNREIAGPSLCPYRPDEGGSLAASVERALAGSFEADPSPFDPDRYFDWLLDMEGAR